MQSGEVTDMMRESTVVYKLSIASGEIRCLDKASIELFYMDNDGVARWVTSDRTSKDDMISLLFDLSLLGYYVNGVKIVRFSLDYIIQVRLSKSKRFRTNLKLNLMEQISQILDKMKKEGCDNENG